MIGLARSKSAEVPAPVDEWLDFLPEADRTRSFRALELLKTHWDPARNGGLEWDDFCRQLRNPKDDARYFGNMQSSYISANGGQKLLMGNLLGSDMFVDVARRESPLEFEVACINLGVRVDDAGRLADSGSDRTATAYSRLEVVAGVMKRIDKEKLTPDELDAIRRNFLGIVRTLYGPALYAMAVEYHHVLADKPEKQK